MMGDGSINKQRKGHNPYLEVSMISRNYLEYVDDRFGTLGNGVSLRKTAEESAKENRERGFSRVAEADNYSDIYRWQSVSHPELISFMEWYEVGDKVWPADIELTPTVLKHWYCGDGCWDNYGSCNRISITVSNEGDNTKKIDRMFKRVELPSPSNYVVNEYEEYPQPRVDAVFTVEQSRKLWNYMGSPLPDFGYKWPEDQCRNA